MLMFAGLVAPPKTHADRSRRLSISSVHPGRRRRVQSSSRKAARPSTSSTRRSETHTGCDRGPVGFARQRHRRRLQRRRDRTGPLRGLQVRRGLSASDGGPGFNSSRARATVNASVGQLLVGGTSMTKWAAAIRLRGFARFVEPLNRHPRPSPSGRRRRQSARASICRRSRR